MTPSFKQFCNVSKDLICSIKEFFSFQNCFDSFLFCAVDYNEPYIADVLHICYNHLSHLQVFKNLSEKDGLCLAYLFLYCDSVSYSPAD